MSAAVGFAVALVFWGPSALAAEIAYGGDADYDRASVETYAWVTSREVEEDPLTHQRIVSAVDYWMLLRGRRAVSLEQSPDVLLTYHSDSTGEVVLAPTPLGYRVRRSWRWTTEPGGPPPGELARYPMGTLVLDVWDARGRELVFRGAASEAVPARPERLGNRIGEAVRRLVAGFAGDVGSGEER